MREMGIVTSPKNDGKSTELRELRAEVERTKKQNEDEAKLERERIEKAEQAIQQIRSDA